MVRRWPSARSQLTSMADDTNGEDGQRSSGIERRSSIERVSVADDESEGNGTAVRVSASADGRFIAFGSGSTNLVATDTNGARDIFVRDRLTGQTTVVRPAGGEANSGSETPVIAPDGSFVVFRSSATNWTADVDSNGEDDIILAPAIFAAVAPDAGM